MIELFDNCLVPGCRNEREELGVFCGHHTFIKTLAPYAMASWLVTRIEILSSFLSFSKDDVITFVEWNCSLTVFRVHAKIYPAEDVPDPVRTVMRALEHVVELCPVAEILERAIRTEAKFRLAERTTHASPEKHDRVLDV